MNSEMMISIYRSNYPYKESFLHTLQKGWEEMDTNQVRISFFSSMEWWRFDVFPQLRHKKKDSMEDTSEKVQYSFLEKEEEGVRILSPPTAQVSAMKKKRKHVRAISFTYR